MAISFKTVKCPDCNSNLSVEEGRNKIFCTYCGCQIIIANDNEHIYHHVNEAEVRKAEAEKIIRLKELEMEERENNKDRKSRKTAYTVWILFIIVSFFIIMINPNKDIAYVSLLMIVIGVLGLFYTFIFHATSDVNKKRNNRYLSSDEVAITYSMCDCEGTDVQSVYKLFQAAGFTNVQTIPLHDVVFSQRKVGKVASVTINATEILRVGDIFSKDAVVLINYHIMR